MGDLLGFFKIDGACKVVKFRTQNLSRLINTYWKRAGVHYTLTFQKFGTQIHLWITYKQQPSLLTQVEVRTVRNRAWFEVSPPGQEKIVSLKQLTFVPIGSKDTIQAITYCDQHLQELVGSKWVNSDSATTLTVVESGGAYRILLTTEGLTEEKSVSLLTGTVWKKQVRRKTKKSITGDEDASQDEQHAKKPNSYIVDNWPKNSILHYPGDDLKKMV